MLSCSKDGKITPNKLVEQLSAQMKTKYTMIYHLFMKKMERGRMTSEEMSTIEEGKKYWESLQSTATDLAVEIPSKTRAERNRSLVSKFSSSLEGSKTPKKEKGGLNKLTTESIGPFPSLKQKTAKASYIITTGAINRTLRSQSKPDQDSLLENENSPIFSTL